MNTVKVLKALANDTRLEIVRILLNEKRCVRSLARHFGVSEATVCVHLRLLREAELLIGERVGYFMHYSVNKTVLHELSAFLNSMDVPGADSGSCHCQSGSTRHCKCKKESRS